MDPKLRSFILTTAILVSLILPESSVLCDESSTNSALPAPDNSAGTAHEGETGNVFTITTDDNKTRTEVVLSQLYPGVATRPHKPIDIEKFKKYNDFDSKRLPCDPSTVDSPAPVQDGRSAASDACLEATIATSQDGKLDIFLGFVLNCNPNDKEDFTKGGTCGCIEETEPVEYAEKRKACLKKDLEDGKECISSLECKDKLFCDFRKKDESFEGTCKSSSSSAGPHLAIMFLASVVTYFRFL